MKILLLTTIAFGGNAAAQFDGGPNDPQLAPERAAEDQAARQQAERERAALEQARAEAELQTLRQQLERTRQELEVTARNMARQIDFSAFENGANNLYRFINDGSTNFFGGRAQLGLLVTNGDEGVRVTGVTPGTPAARAGIVVDDVIVRFNDVDLSAADEPSALLFEALEEVEPNSTAVLVIDRDGETVAVDVELASPGAFYMLNRATGADGDNRQLRNFRLVQPFSLLNDAPFGDMELVALTEGLGRYFDTDEGLLIVRAPSDDSIALEDGDVILAIGGRTPSSPEHAMRILASFEPGETIEFSIMREGRRRTVEYEVPQAG
ncbi:MAG: PDZ domain-containing protein [Gammaproteobacteria bacterium]|nr:PDZ domain-containing protein [Gammaproteobacteria bacterium]